MMDWTRNYDGFESDIKESFRNIILNYDFHFTTIDEGYYELNNEKVKISFSFDRGDLFCFISDSNFPNEEYSIISVYEFLFPHEKIINYSYTTKRQLQIIAEVAEKKLSNILYGDFSWVSEYRKENDLINKMIMYVEEELDQDSSIYKKYEKDDPSWIDDMKIYIMQNKISL